MSSRVLSLVAVTFLIGCGKNFTETSFDPWARPAIIHAELADELSTAEKMLVPFDLYFLENLNLHGSDRFAQLFGGHDSTAASRWIAEGVHYVAPGSRDSFGDAENFGISLYLSGLLKGEFSEIEWTSGKRMTPSTSKNGLIILHHYENHGNTLRASMWPHERRHGDCPTPPSHQDLVEHLKLLKAKEPVPAEMRKCGHEHILCPSDHALAGKPACDDSRDGAYTYSLEWARAVRDTCANCDDSIKDVSAAMVIEYESRIVVP